jgi:hypothetical protein
MSMAVVILPNMYSFVDLESENPGVQLLKLLLLVSITLATLVPVPEIS